MTDHRSVMVGLLWIILKFLPPLATSYQISALEFLVQRVPAPTEADLFGALSGSVLFEGDIVAPLDKAYDANRN